MKVSIIIPLYNGALLIERCLDLVFSQVGDYQTEVIVVDDGSTDDSMALVNAYYQIITVMEQTNQRMSVARNIGLEQTKDTYVAFLDVDDYLGIIF